MHNVTIFNRVFLALGASGVAPPARWCRVLPEVQVVGVSEARFFADFPVGSSGDPDVPAGLVH